MLGIPTFVIHFGAPCCTPMIRSLRTMPVSGSTVRDRVSTEWTCVANGFGYLRCRLLSVCVIGKLSVSSDLTRPSRDVLVDYVGLEYLHRSRTGWTGWRRSGMRKGISRIKSERRGHEVADSSRLMVSVQDIQRSQRVIRLSRQGHFSSTRSTFSRLLALQISLCVITRIIRTAAIFAFIQPT